MIERHWDSLVKYVSWVHTRKRAWRTHGTLFMLWHFAAWSRRLYSNHTFVRVAKFAINSHRCFPEPQEFVAAAVLRKIASCCPALFSLSPCLLFGRYIENLIKVAGTEKGSPGLAVCDQFQDWLCGQQMSCCTGLPKGSACPVSQEMVRVGVRACGPPCPHACLSVCMSICCMHVCACAIQLATVVLLITAPRSLPLIAPPRLTHCGLSSKHLNLVAHIHRHTPLPLRACTCATRVDSITFLP